MSSLQAWVEYGLNRLQCLRAPTCMCSRAARASSFATWRGSSAPLGPKTASAAFCGKMGSSSSGAGYGDIHAADGCGLSRRLAGTAGQLCMMHEAQLCAAAHVLAREIDTLGMQDLQATHLSVPCRMLHSPPYTDWCRLCI